MTLLFERLAARAAAVAPLAVPGLQLVPRGAIALAEHVNRYYRVLHGTDPENVALRLPTGGGSFEVRHSATNAALLRVTDAGLDFPAGGIGTVELADGSVTSAKILDNEIVNADINAAAGIVLSKLQAVASNQVLVGTGAGVGSRTLVDADIAAAGAANIAVNKLLHVGANNVVRSNGAQNVAGQVANADLAGNIAVNKLLHVGAGNVLRSDGAQNVAGQVVTGDIADGTIMNIDINAAAGISGSKLLDNSVTSVKLAGGIAVGAGSITTTEIQDGTIATVDLALGAISQLLNAVGPSADAVFAANAAWIDVGVGFSMTLLANTTLLYTATCHAIPTTLGNGAQIRLVRDGPANTQVGWVSPVPTAAVAAQQLTMALCAAAAGPGSAGTYAFKLQALFPAGSTGTMKIPANTVFMSVAEVKR